MNLEKKNRIYMSSGSECANDDDDDDCTCCSSKNLLFHFNPGFQTQTDEGVKKSKENYSIYFTHSLLKVYLSESASLAYNFIHLIFC